MAAIPYKPSPNCLVCDKSIRGQNKLVGLCHLHFNPNYFNQCLYPRRLCIHQGCTTKVREYFNLFCYRHDKNKQLSRKLKPFLRDIDSLDLE